MRRQYWRAVAAQELVRFLNEAVGRRNSLKIEAKERVVGSAWSFWPRARASHDGIVHFAGEAVASAVNE